MEHYWNDNDKGKRKFSVKIPLHWDFVRHKFHKKLAWDRKEM
jgi:hypothetical protein